jgi:hypothetical protein
MTSEAVEAKLVLQELPDSALTITGDECCRLAVNLLAQNESGQG